MDTIHMQYMCKYFPMARIPRKAVGPVYWESHPQAGKRPRHVYRKRVGYSTDTIQNGLDTKWAMPASGTNCQTISLVHCTCSAGNKSIINKKKK